MSKKKYYAVKVGKTPGIYFTWADCSAQVTGFKGAIYKSFPTIEEALRFIDGDNTKKEQNIVKSRPKEQAKKKDSSTKKIIQGKKIVKEGYDVKPIRSTANVKTYKSYINPKEIEETYEFIAFVDGSYDRTSRIFGSGE